eukprot:1160940-Pelagomonas_calceolata.AAC.6
MEDLKVAWLAVKHVKSNAITVVKDKKLLGMGSGQPNRVNSVRVVKHHSACFVFARVPCARMCAHENEAMISTARTCILHGDPFTTCKQCHLTCTSQLFVRICMEKAGAEAEGAVLASDAFFPFSWNDGVELACQSGIKAIAHPGGSIRDQVRACMRGRVGAGVDVVGVCSMPFRPRACALPGPNNLTRTIALWVWVGAVLAARWVGGCC